jgi:hypothetical protein
MSETPTDLPDPADPPLPDELLLDELQPAAAIATTAMPAAATTARDRRAPGWGRMLGMYYLSGGERNASDIPRHVTTWLRSAAPVAMGKR